MEENFRQNILADIEVHHFALLSHSLGRVYLILELELRRLDQGTTGTKLSLQGNYRWLAFAAAI